MIGGLIALGVLVLLLLLLLTPVVLRLEYDDIRSFFFWKVSWLGVSLFSSEEKGLFQWMKRKFRRRSVPEKKTKTESSKKEWKRYWESFRKTASILPKPLRLFWKGISICGLTVGVQVGRFDAKECVIAYGAANALLYTALGMLQSMMRVRMKHVQVKCVFGMDRMDWIVRGKIHVCPLAALAALLSFAVGMAMQWKQDAPNRKKTQQAASNLQEECESEFPHAEFI